MKKKCIIISNIKFDYIASEVIIQHSPPDFSYDDSYFLNYKNRSNTDMGRALSKFRQEYVNRFTDGKILDYGSGYGTLVRLDESKRWMGYDIMEKTKLHLGPKFDQNAENNFANYSAICFFDVLEHLYNPAKILGMIPIKSFAIVTMPIVSNWNNLAQITQWKHWKPQEHILYSSHAGLIDFMKMNNLDLIDHSDYETVLGRDDIHTFCFQKH